MKLAVALVLAGCWGEPPPVAVSNHPATKRPSIEEMTPVELPGVKLGMSVAELHAVRPRAQAVYSADGRDSFEEPLDLHGIAQVHYDSVVGGPLYQITLLYNDASMAHAVWDSYRGLGHVVADPDGTPEILVRHRYPFDVRIWTLDRSVTWVAIIDGTEWWQQYHPEPDTIDP